MNDQHLLALSRCSLFRSLKISEINRLFSDITCKIKKYDGNSVVMTRGEPYNSLIVILSGELDAEINDPAGRTIKMETLKSSSIVASAILFASEASLPVTLTAAAGKKTTLLYIPSESVIKLCLSSPAILLNYLRDTGDKVTFLAEKIRLFKFSNLRQKTAGFLIDLSLRQKSEMITLPYTKEVISEIFGVTRPSLSRVFSELAHEGTISQNGKKISILDRKKLVSILRDSELE